MPTGYTAFITDGDIDNAGDFLLLCARAFGATISMRDEPLSKPIPEKFKRDDYHKKALEREIAALERYRSMTQEEIHAANKARYEEETSMQKKVLDQYRSQNEKLEAVLAGVEKWVPPTSEHEGLKDFAINQIKISLNDLSWLDTPIKMASDQEWIESRIRCCLDAIEYHRKKDAEEDARVAERNKWLQDLRDSIQTAA